MIFNSQLVCIILLIVTVVSCNKNEQNQEDQVAQAQSCLDKVPDSDPSQANNCLPPISNLTSQQAYILKCSITLIAGGLTTSKVVAAYQAFEDASSNKAAILIGAFALSSGVAEQAAPFCNLSGQDGLIYIAQLSVAGSVLTSVIPGYDPASGAIPTQTQIQSAISTCTSGGCDDSQLGSAVITVGQTYCNVSGANPTVCGPINQAIASAGTSNPAGVAQALYPLLN